MFLLVSVAVAGEIPAYLAPEGHAYTGALISRSGACADPQALDAVLARLAADERAALQDFEVGSPRLPSRSVSLDVVSADVHSVFRLLARQGGINIVVADGVQGQVSLVLQDTPWDQVLEVVMASSRLDAVVGDGLIVVYPIEG